MGIFAQQSVKRTNRSQSGAENIFAFAAGVNSTSSACNWTPRTTRRSLGISQS